MSFKFRFASREPHTSIGKKHPKIAVHKRISTHIQVLITLNLRSRSKYSLVLVNIAARHLKNPTQFTLRTYT